MNILKFLCFCYLLKESKNYMFFFIKIKQKICSFSTDKREAKNLFVKK